MHNLEIDFNAFALTPPAHLLHFLGDLFIPVRKMILVGRRDPQLHGIPDAGKFMRWRVVFTDQSQILHAANGSPSFQFTMVRKG